ncbi:hypothetical protein [Sphingomonas mali]|uniref:hypothetical protein n=1 Tax=Sphingomonas mali TaxID=40682 RepID=UPI000A4539CA|nr:hypothetical protein [Sphingomonas mali]
MRLPVRLALAAVAALFLSSCWWVGAPFYKGNPADAGPVRPGVYKVDLLGDGKPAHLDRIIWQPDGTILFTPLRPRKDEQPSRLVMVRFAVTGRDLWIVQDMPEEGQTEVTYGLAELHGEVLWVSPLIDCDSTAEIVRAAGGEVEEEAVTNTEDSDAPLTTNSIQAVPAAPAKPVGGATCRFKDQASLERALRAYIATNPPLPERIRFKRIGD